MARLGGFITFGHGVGEGSTSLSFECEYFQTHTGTFKPWSDQGSFSKTIITMEI
jgi:hypothetical protein